MSNKYKDSNDETETRNKKLCIRLTEEELKEVKNTLLNYNLFPDGYEVIKSK